MPRILSGIRPTGQLHLGNYLGALVHFVRLAENPNNQCLFFVANLHGLTTVGASREAARAAASEMKEDIIGIVIDYLAAGLDPNAGNVLIYAQSSVPEISELTWILSCVTPLSELLGMHHFADKRAKLGEGDSVNAGLLGYPVLMAADILAPQAEIVPVGDDQREHLELARRTARRFNDRYSRGFFPEPMPMDEPQVRVPGLKGQGKMGKSEPKGTINLTDDAETVRRKVQKADKALPVKPGGVAIEPRVGDAPGNVDECRVFRLHEHLSFGNDRDPFLAEVRFGCSSGELSCGECKQMLAQRMNDLLDPIRERRAQLLSSKRSRDLAVQILVEHGRRARDLILPTVEEAKDLVGVPSFRLKGAT